VSRQIFRFHILTAGKRHNLRCFFRYMRLLLSLSACIPESHRQMSADIRQDQAENRRRVNLYKNGHTGCRDCKGKKMTDLHGQALCHRFVLRLPFACLNAGINFIHIASIKNTLCFWASAISSSSCLQLRVIVFSHSTFFPFSIHIFAFS